MVYSPEGERLVDVPEPTAQPDEVLVRVEYCGICGSDLHAGEPDFHVGTVMGHEFSGTVLEIGRDVSGFKVGDRVVVNPNGDWCGDCPQCRAGRVNLCPNVWSTAVGLARSGGLAPYAAVRARTLHKIPDELGLLEAAWVEPLAVALRAVRRSGLAVGDSAVVFGGGPVGLLVTGVLKAAGATQITVVEPNPSRRAMAARQGATVVLDPKEVSVVEHFAAAEDRPLFAFECSGVAEAVGQALSVLPPTGTLAMTGFSRRPPSFSSADVLHKELTILGNFIYRQEFSDAIGLLATGAVSVADLVSGVLSIDEAPSAFEAMRTSPTAIKFLLSAFHASA